MIRITVTDRNAVRPVELGAHMLRAIYARHRKNFSWREGTGIERLSGSRALRLAVESGSVEELVQRWSEESNRFSREIDRYRLYR